MADPKVTVRIQGEDATGAAFSSALGNAKSTADRMSKLFKTAFVGLSVAGFVSAGRQVIEFGDNIAKAATKAGIGGKAMSELAYAARMADVDIGGLSSSLRFMQKNLSEAASGAKGPNEALAALGLTIDQIKGLNADAQFELIADRINSIKDPADRARAATELFGKAGADLLPMFEQGAEGIRKWRQEAERLGLSLSDDQIQRLADADDAIKRLRASFDGLAATLVAKVAPSLTAVLNNISAVVTGDQIGKLKEQIDFLTRMQGRSFVAAGYGEIGTGFFTAEEGARKLTELRAKLAALETRDAARRAMPGGGFASVFAPNASGMVAPGYQPPADKPKAEKEKKDQPFPEFKFEPIRPPDNFLKDFEEATRTSTEKMLAKNRELTAQLQVLRERGLISEKVYIERLLAATDELMPSLEKIKEVSPYAEEAARGIQDALKNFLFDPFRSGLKGMAQGIVQTFQSILAEIAAAKLANSLIGTVDKAGNLTGGLFSSGINKLFGGFFADGGNPPVGKFSVVGERGPEIIVPRSQATVMPMGAMGRAVTVAPTYNIDARGATQDLIQALPAILEANTRRTVELARAAVRDDVSRRAMR